MKNIKEEIKKEIKCCIHCSNKTSLREEIIKKLKELKGTEEEIGRNEALSEAIKVVASEKGG